MFGMYFHWGFPLLGLPQTATADAVQVNFWLTFAACLILVTSSLIGLYINTKSGYEGKRSREALALFLGALVFWIFGFLPILLAGFIVGVAYFLTRYVIWRFLVKWLLWQIILLNVWAALGGKIKAKEEPKPDQKPDHSQIE